VLDGSRHGFRSLRPFPRTARDLGVSVAAGPLVKRLRHRRLHRRAHRLSRRGQRCGGGGLRKKRRRNRQPFRFGVSISSAGCGTLGSEPGRGDSLMRMPDASVAGGPLALGPPGYPKPQNQGPIPPTATPLASALVCLLFGGPRGLWGKRRPVPDPNAQCLICGLTPSAGAPTPTQAPAPRSAFANR
jgi:hypothetical protein